ncbi:MAG: fibronectin type III domain-containing protein [Mariprofundaceae bacterium]
MRKIILILAILALALGGCGRKEPPQPVADAPPPKIVMFKHAVEVDVLHITIKITGGSYGVGFQVDRSEIDPSCKCPSFWRRFYEKPVSNKHFDKKISKFINLKADTEYAFRVRAIDALGRFTEWTEPFLTKSEDTYK